MFSIRIGDWVGLKDLGGRVSGPYIVRRHAGYDVEIACVRTGRRMVVLSEDICEAPRK